jgi:2'-5' RNA ligase
MSVNAPWRLFFAIWPPLEIATLLNAWSRTAQVECGGRVTLPANIHLTLAFLGDVSPGRAKRLAECGRRAGGVAHSLALEQARYWKHNRVVWAGPSVIPPALGSLAQALTRELIAADFPTEVREFNAHVTLIRQARLPRILPGLPTIIWPVSEMVLVRTQLSSTGSSYAMLERFALT